MRLAFFFSLLFTLGCFIFLNCEAKAAERVWITESITLIEPTQDVFGNSLSLTGLDGCVIYVYTAKEPQGITWGFRSPNPAGGSRHTLVLKGKYEGFVEFQGLCSNSIGLSALTTPRQRVYVPCS